MLRMWMFAVLVASNVHLAHKLLTPEIPGPPIAPSMWAIALTPSALLFRQQQHVLFKTNHICIDANAPYYTGKIKVTWACRNYASDSSSPPSRPWQRIRSYPIFRYLQHFRWTPIPLALALTYIAYHQFRQTQKREQLKLEGAPCLATELEVSFYKMLPLRAASRWWGWFNSLQLPSWLRQPLISLFIATYGCDITEAACEDLQKYHNLGEFFRRELKPSVRPIHPGNCVVSPADGTVLHFGKVEDGHPEQVKGISYSLKAFLGPHNWDDDDEMVKLYKARSVCAISDKNYQESLLHHKNGDTELYHCIVYLAPGDYHRFHSPADWNILSRRHFPGELLSVRPGIVGWIAGLFNVNERVVYYGKWKHGFFSMTAVGATNVGSIKVYFDKDLETNKKHYIRDSYHDHSFKINNNTSGIIMNKGDPFGEFNLGSTMVLIFEAPKGSCFDVKPGQKIKYGELLSKFEPVETKEDKR